MGRRGRWGCEGGGDGDGGVMRRMGGYERGGGV